MSDEQGVESTGADAPLPESGSKVSFYTYMERFLKEVPHKGTPDLRILKAHILAEEGLVRYVETRLPNPDPYKKGPRVLFAARLRLAEAITPKVPEGDWIWEALDKLNNHRNSYAHRIEHSQREEIGRNLIKACKQSGKWDEYGGPGPGSSDADYALILTCMELDGRLTVTAHIQEKLRAPFS